MDILTALEAAHAPLSVEELKEFCGPMFSSDRLDSLERSGDVKSVPGLPNIYWSVPPALKKKTSIKKCLSPMRVTNRSEIIKKILEMKGKLISISQELDAIQLMKDQFPTEEQMKARREHLHEYNDMKDIGLLLFDKLAEIDRVTVKSLYEKYGLDEND